MKKIIIASAICLLFASNAGAYQAPFLSHQCDFERYSSECCSGTTINYYHDGVFCGSQLDSRDNCLSDDQKKYLSEGYNMIAQSQKLLPMCPEMYVSASIDNEEITTELQNNPLIIVAPGKSSEKEMHNYMISKFYKETVPEKAVGSVATGSVSSPITSPSNSKTTIIYSTPNYNDGPVIYKNPVVSADSVAYFQKMDELKAKNSIIPVVAKPAVAGASIIKLTRDEILAKIQEVLTLINALKAQLAAITK